MSEINVDQKLVERVQRGDKAAFNLLVTKYQHKVANLVSRYVKNHSDVPDIVQEAFIKAYRALPNFRGDSAFYTWLYRIAVNCAKNHMVASNRKPPGSDIEVEDAEIYDSGEALRENASPEKLLLTNEIKKVIFDTIEQLPNDLRTAINLRELEGLSYEEIAHIMDCPVGTVRSRIFRARDAVDKKIRPLLQN
ncbi:MULTISPECIES: RNA polymerase sigma factor RpoE [unclassified Colwellia]|jgi:RNA polymerase sigma-70 factor (ECF subfamily)|uniref:RNA polymerase sigma factor RpoE n=1 Tax=unclassified Colwellia TaxID=196834 RepID=UPI0015F723C5|nr:MULTISPECIES: RNA polymerase sigma factor RpoE [unclassified Colwellia]MBA6233295.1 RNA polymerase sigma factor RpoE [Colwellia sp. MB02u-7]MBA6236385.1 RNA polymerase sigma factor RpoE [Colwellia sp. MB02u-11]MBA6256919.1 RNA polymerase sigma factor RpoE [Colwellia sp. MB3u-28]MBA6261075.1 RNA polymerase sigma factor RpoE [Colwellia sp. MB3u-41]MBA6264200.1 RNA polymerase sigma factor RpoE [Colwellia sp. Bg11-12]